MKVAIYCRCSTSYQTVEAQLHSCLDYCKQNNIHDYVIFKDEAISGSTTSRPALNELMNRVRSGEFKSIITFSFSRIGRSTIHLLKTLEELNQLQVDFISVSERLDTSSPIGRVIFSILSSLAQFEREQISIRVKSGLENARSKGKRIGVEKQFKDALPFLQLKKKGLSSREIAKILNCSQSTVMRMLKTESKGDLYSSTDAPSKTNVLDSPQSSNSEISERKRTLIGINPTNQNRLNRTLVKADE